MDVANRFGVELVTVPEVAHDDGTRSVPIETLLAAADHWRTRLVALSHVEYASGQRHDLATLGRFCRDRQILFCVDAIQSMGVLPIDVRAMNIDFLSADGHKWLLGPEGAGVFFCRRELLPTLRPLSVGWMNVVNDQDYGNYDLTLKPDARRFECGTHNIPGLLALKASLELLLELGVDAVASRLKSLTDRATAGLRLKGYQVISPRDAEAWSGIVSFISPQHDHKTLWRDLRMTHNTELALREGRLRISAHLYNTEDQIDRLLAHLPSH
jgi:selenocysteine lyase/cysteine desulfurase